MTLRHQPVLLKEAIEQLNIKSDGIYIDATFGRGGHSKAILEKLDEKGFLLAIDKDPEAVKIARQLVTHNKQFYIEHSSFVKIKTLAAKYNIEGKVDGILLDLGVSSPQLDESGRGFSFLHEGPLDMRMNPNVGQSAKEWISKARQTEIAEVLKTYGEERYAKRIANAIVTARQTQPITTTTELAEIIKKANPAWEQHKHPATRSFQAIRIFINKELEELELCLPNCIDVLAINGRLAVISFHSLEDRVVKRFIRGEVVGAALPRDLPVYDYQINRRLKKCGNVIKPSAQEIKLNPRARSAILRVAKRIG